MLSGEVSAREGSGAEFRIRAAGFLGRKSLEDFNLDQPALKRDTIAHMGTATFVFSVMMFNLASHPVQGKELSGDVSLQPHVRASPTSSAHPTAR